MATQISKSKIQNPKSFFEESNSFSQVVELLRIESVAIENAANRLQPKSVNRAVELLSRCGGKVILLGIGKSGIIAQKIAQTLTSTGTVAVFLHPSDAVHGSLGIVTDGDVVIALSNSGETDEIIALLPAIQQRKVSIIAIVGNVDSTLARQAAIVLDASVDKEACPLNLAPTTSTTVALAIGDALAMTLMQLKNLTPADFAANHPGGRLGKRLTLRVADLMHQSPSVAVNATWLEVVHSISKYGLGAVNVVDSQTNLIGIVTDGDLRRTIEKTATENLRRLTAEMMMTRQPVCIAPDALAYDALKLMENRPRQISVLPVTTATGECVGLLRLHDIVKSGL